MHNEHYLIFSRISSEKSLSEMDTAALTIRFEMCVCQMEESLEGLDLQLAIELWFSEEDEG